MIYCANNNTLYEQAADACKDLGLDEASVSKHLAGQRRSVGSYVLTKVDDTNAEALQAVRRCLLYSAYKIIIDVDENPRYYEGGENHDLH